MSTHTTQKSSPGLGVWEHYTVQDGLPDMKIESLLVDSKGIIWIGTHDRGVVRFDGDNFEMFTRKDGLAGDCVLSIIEDREGALWFGTRGADILFAPFFVPRFQLFSCCKTIPKFVF